MQDLIRFRGVDAVTQWARNALPMYCHLAVQARIAKEGYIITHILPEKAFLDGIVGGSDAAMTRPTAVCHDTNA